jgi:hypothetical protein
MSVMLTERGLTRGYCTVCAIGQGPSGGGNAGWLGGSGLGLRSYGWSRVVAAWFARTYAWSRGLRHASGVHVRSGSPTAACTSHSSAA